jgi:hypothetical protein
MALLFYDGFDYYATANFPQRYTAAGSDWDVVAAIGRFGTSGARQTSGAAPTLSKTLATNYATLIAGVACSRSAIAGTNPIIFAFFDGSTEQVSVRIAATTGLVGVYRNGTLLANSSFAVSTGVYFYVELKSTIHNTTGTYDLQINGVNVLSATGVNTRGSANNFANRLVLGSTNNISGTITLDDLYVCDTSGSANNNFLGDVRVETLFPNGAGNSTQFTPSTGVNNAAVDEATPNTTDYVTSTADNQIDTYTFTDLASSGVTVYGVQEFAYAQKTDASAKSVALVTRPGSTNNAGSDKALSTSFTYYSDIQELNPDTSSAWTTSQINATEFGIKSRP